jgi:hypothetical protein
LPSSRAEAAAAARSSSPSSSTSSTAPPPHHVSFRLQPAYADPLEFFRTAGPVAQARRRDVDAFAAAVAARGRAAVTVLGARFARGCGDPHVDTAVLDILEAAAASRDPMWTAAHALGDVSTSSPANHQAQLAMGGTGPPGAANPDARVRVAIERTGGTGISPHGVVLVGPRARPGEIAGHVELALEIATDAEARTDLELECAAKLGVRSVHAAGGPAQSARFAQGFDDFLDHVATGGGAALFAAGVQRWVANSHSNGIDNTSAATPPLADVAIAVEDFVRGEAVVDPRTGIIRVPIGACERLNRLEPLGYTIAAHAAEAASQYRSWRKRNENWAALVFEARRKLSTSSITAARGTARQDAAQTVQALARIARSIAPCVRGVPLVIGDAWDLALDGTLTVPVALEGRSATSQR